LARVGPAGFDRAGTIPRAHTLEERIPKAQILEAVQIYKRMVQQLFDEREQNPVGILAPPAWWGSTL